MKTAFKFKERLFEVNGIVMGFKNTPMIIQRTMQKLFDYKINAILWFKWII